MPPKSKKPAASASASAPKKKKPVAASAPKRKSAAAATTASSPKRKPAAKKKPASAKRSSAKHTPKVAQAQAAQGAQGAPMQALPPMLPQQQQQQQPFPIESEELKQCRREAYNKYLSKCDATCQKNVITPCIQSSVDQFHKLVMNTMNAGQMETSMASWPVGSLWDRENPPPTNAMGPKGKKVLHEYRRCINHTLRSSPEFDAVYQKQCGAHMTAPPSAP